MLDKLERYDVTKRPNIDVIKKEAYDAGMKDAWEIARKICCYASDGGFTNKEIIEMFKTADTHLIMSNTSVVGAKNVIEAWEKEQEY